MSHRQGGLHSSPRHGSGWTVPVLAAVSWHHKEFGPSSSSMAEIACEACPLTCTWGASQQLHPQGGSVHTSHMLLVDCSCACCRYSWRARRTLMPTCWCASPRHANTWSLCTTRACALWRATSCASRWRRYRWKPSSQQSRILQRPATRSSDAHSGAV